MPPSPDPSTGLPRPDAVGGDASRGEGRPLPPGVLRLDPVVGPLVEAGVVAPAHVFAAVAAGGAGPLWRRVLALHPTLDRSAAVRIAADVHGVDGLDAAPSPAFVAHVLDLLPPAVAHALRTARLLPVRVETGDDGTATLVVATDDPFDDARTAVLAPLGAGVRLVLTDAATLDAGLGALPEADPALPDADSALPEVDPSVPEEGSTGVAGDVTDAGLADDLAVHLAAVDADTPALDVPSLDIALGDADAVDAVLATLPQPSGDGLARHSSPVDLDTRDRVVHRLARKGLVTAEQVAEAQRRQADERPREALWRVLASGAGVPREAVFAEAAAVYAFPVAAIGEGRPGADFVRSVFATFPEERRDRLMALGVVPLEADLHPASGELRLVFATHDPARPEVQRTIQALRLDRFEVHYAPEAAVRQALDDAFPRRNEFLERLQEGGGMALDLGATFEQARSVLIDEDALEAEIGRSTLINLFEATLLEAVRNGASDIHIYPNHRRQIEIHFRIDGRLGRWHVEDKVHPEAMLAVVKDNATGIDRFEREKAQDGFIQRTIDDALIRFRVSVLPVANANGEIRSESIVIRILDDRKVVTDLRKLGLNDVALDRFDHAIRQPHGMVILTGPTGSGKSTTLVASLAQVVTPEVNVLTVEDPVEYIIPGVRQIKLGHKLGLEDALRAILRHDPDVVMVGEMRDRATAELAIKLANTGHLTFSTLHTNDAPSAVSRLFKMGIEPFLIAYAINLVVAQRLVRLLCPTCKRLDPDPDPHLRAQLGVSPEAALFEASRDRSCRTCKGSGYKGRKAINECLLVSRAIRRLIVESDTMVDEEAIRQTAIAEGMLTLADSARLLVEAGETSLDEMLRATASDA